MRYAGANGTLRVGYYELTTMTNSSSTSSGVSPTPGSRERDRPSPPMPLGLLAQVQASLKKTLARYSPQIGNGGISTGEIGTGKMGTGKGPTSPNQVQSQLEQVTKNLAKLDQGILRIAVFGLVSRGKSSVINALVQQDVFQTGPLHGVTKWPRSVYWELPNNPSQLRIELIDTPGLDEVEGAVRADMAQEVAQEADLILFVLAGAIMVVEQDALTDLLAQQKPIVVVCNKCDRHPDFDAAAVLETLGLQSPDSPSSSSAVTQDRSSVKTWSLTRANIVQVAAAPDPVQVRVEWPDGRISHEWETPPAQVEPLAQRLHQILQEDGWLLIVLNALRESQAAETAMAATAIASHSQQADTLLWHFAKWKSVVVAANPIAVADIIGGMTVDLIMIRALAQLYGLPMTGHEASKLWRAIAWSTLGLTLGEAGTSLLWGFGKSAAVLAGPFGGVTAYSATAITQGMLAGYGAYRVGKAAQVYLQQGCTWGPDGISTVMQAIADQVDRDRVLTHLSADLRTKKL
ncbi:MAG: DUF697 domain-containing protein [Cyanothece sp. SIO2G6]|nr:DUF697 domain-containing protein [Cyanothece sp. SIO2G6]